MNVKSPASYRDIRAHSDILRHRGGSYIIAKQRVVLQMVLKSSLEVGEQSVKF